MCVSASGLLDLWQTFVTHFQMEIKEEQDVIRLVRSVPPCHLTRLTRIEPANQARRDKTGSGTGSSRILAADRCWQTHTHTHTLVTNEDTSYHKTFLTPPNLSTLHD